ncbi:hypothetical protein EXU57_23660 [Segetibacter sp. 3557_3]|uniref:putative signal transducing protein n=1 Tax=Segetibacter sp. 3557_3 TaxID=2547429 RepID=UPI0010591BCB|nr:DUF2007 domain-containing protein [Segetibacter sp. 3557_3]TDH18357.1 hypothetical protein EXU57_23660 [Segetibacter sp. 3557_3]
MNNWFLLHTTTSNAEASILKGMLEEHAIRVMLLNRQDSSYLVFGEIEVYVPTHQKDEARELMDQGLT